MCDWPEIKPGMTAEEILETYNRLNLRYQEILKLDRMPTAADIPHTLERIFDGYQVCYPVGDPTTRVCDAVEHFGSYGREADRLELMGLLSPEEEKYDSVVGWLTAEQVFARIRHHWEKQQDEEKEL